MATRCEIGYLNEDGSVDAVYQHWDGYILGVGNELVTNWDSEEKAKKVVGGEFNNETTFHEDSIMSWLMNLKNSDREYVYLWINNEWKFIKINRNITQSVWKGVKEELNDLKTEGEQ